MRNRILITVAGLVLLPTALLSLLAVNALRSRELVLQAQIKAQAHGLVQSVTDRAGVLLSDEIQQVRTVLLARLSDVPMSSEIRDVALRLESTRTLIEEVCVYVNPWGFAYPAEINVSPFDRTRLETLSNVMQREVARAGNTGSLILFTSGGSPYCFAPVHGRKDLYVGFRVSSAAFRAEIENIVRQASGQGIILRVVSRDPEAAQDGIVISDSLGTKTVVAAQDMALAAGWLPRPFENIRVEAFIGDSGEIIARGQEQSRLMGWGILLLAAAICLGLWAVLRMSHLEISRALARSNYVIGISHDLRTPIAAVRMLADSLYLGRVEEGKRQKFLETIVSESERLNRLVERVLFFVRFGQDAIIYHLVPLDLNAFVRSVSDSYLKEPGGEVRSGIEVGMFMGTDTPEVKADESALAQVLLNLLDNAVKYGRSADGICRLEIRTGVERRRRGLLGTMKDRVKISVRDHGVGLEAGERRRVFRPYYRGRAAKQKNLSGVGLGLAMCRGIIEAHDGWIEVSGEQGAEFLVFLPVAEA